MGGEPSLVGYLLPRVGVAAWRWRHMQLNGHR